jgi:hypothetical protein
MTRLAASERQRTSHTNGAGIAGAPASECVGGSGGAEPPGQKKTAGGLRGIAPHAIALAEAEGLQAHAASIRARGTR